MDPTEHRAAIAAEGGRVAALPADALDRPVAACPGWDVARLIGHLGRVHRWAASFLADPASGGDGGDRPPRDGGVLPWYAESLGLLLDELDRHDPDEPAVTFAGPGTAGFWFRRQAHETAVHRWDAEAAVDPATAAPIDAPLAADGIDEWLGFFVPRFVVDVGDGVPSDLVGATLHVHCTDTEGEWLLRLTDGRIEVERIHAKGDAALRGPASDVLLAAWHRLPLEAIDVVGDRDRAVAVLDLVHVR